MYDAIYDGNCSQIDSLIRLGLGVDTKAEGEEWNFLHMALVSLAIPPNPDVIRHLVSLGVDVNGRDSRMWTPLHFAIRTQNSIVVKILIDAGADVNAVNDEGISPLHLCVLECPSCVRIAQMLLAAGASPDTDKGGGTARHLANSISHPDSGALRELFAQHPSKKV
ncbi:ankyrin repeat domain-containing protein [Kolteria novifilia]|uniref:ankyrin repeat domain-containing protein n=1 Tax=Kolteria novifilia TaxID=2527975 RepID=UPI003AF3363B